MHPFFLPMELKELEMYERDLDQPGAKEAVERLGEWYEPDPRSGPKSVIITLENCIPHLVLS